MLFELCPVSQLELAATEAPFQTKERLPQRLIYGSYPEIVTTVGLSDKRELLNNIVNGYLYKGLLMFEEIRKSQKIIEILSLLAFQIGNLVSVHKISKAIGMNAPTVEKYLITERLKKQRYTKLFSNNYFWRTYDQKEVDFVEERDGRLFGFEFKWSKSNSKPPALWLETYPEASFEAIRPGNYLLFIA